MTHALGILVLLVFGGCASVLPSEPSLGEHGKAISEVETSDFSAGMMALGAEKDVAYARGEGAGLVDAPALETYLNGILAKLLAHAPVRNVPAHAYVLASDSFAAKSTADSNIYITLGMLLRLDGEDQIAAVLAHESAHVMLGHTDSSILQATQERALQLSVIAMSIKSGIEDDEKTDLGEAKFKEQSQALLLNTWILGPSWTRGQEHDADLLGADLLAAAGYPPSALASFLAKQREFEGEHAGDPQVDMLDRGLAAFGTDALADASEKSARKAANSDVGDQLLGTTMNAGIGIVRKWGTETLSNLSQTHPDTTERIEAVSHYVTREYPAFAVTGDWAEEWESAKEVDETYEVLASHYSAIQAKNLLTAGDIEAAASESHISLEGDGTRHAYPNFIAALILAKKGDRKGAAARFEAALASRTVGASVFQAASENYLELGDKERARSTMETGYTVLQQAPGIVLPLIRMYQEVGLESDANRVALECAARWPSLQGQCAAAANGTLASREPS